MTVSEENLGGKLPPALRARVTLADIAAESGVSTATVSRVINSPTRVSPETRQVVETAVQRLRYIPDGAARALASRRTRTIGAIVPSISNVISAQTLDTFQAELEAAGYSLLLASSEYDSRSAHRQAEVMMARGVDGLLIVTLKEDPDLYRQLESQGVPFVVTIPDEKLPFVGYDHREAELTMLRFVIDLGHRDIGFVVSRIDRSDRLRERVDSVRAAMSAVGLPFPDSRLIEVEHSDLGAGRDALRALQTRGPLPTAILASDDNIAVGLIFECMKQGISVPGDLSICGYGDMEIATHITPTLTTVRTPKAAIGTLAAQYLLSFLSKRCPPIHQLLQPELMVRETSGRPRRTWSIEANEKET